MSLFRIQGVQEKRRGVYYEFDPSSEPLGEGGMGKVFKGRCVDEKAGSACNVAIKFMYSDLPPYAIEKARREAAIQFRHDNLIEMLGFIETETKSVLGEPEHHYHVVSELLEGVSLDKMFEGKLTDQQGHFVPYAEKLYRDYQQDVNHFAVEIIKNILSGLMMMHDAGYIHRDIDPTNIMITSNGKIKLIDFGIAKKINALTSHDKHLTTAGQFVGKPEYAAPELVLGAIDEQNQTTDIYAVGILLFQCIVGHVPFEGDRSDVLQKQLHSPIPLRLVKDKGLRKIIEIATDKSRSKRFQSAAEFRVALERRIITGGEFWWKYILGTVAACAVIGFCVNYWLNLPEQETFVPDYPSEIVEHPENNFDYPTALEAIKKGDISQMEILSKKGDADATYLLSRLYFKSKTSKLTSSFQFDTRDTEFEEREIALLRMNLSDFRINNTRAHELLLKTIKQDPCHYKAHFELACDYWRTDDRTDAVDQKRDMDKIKEHFGLARKYADQAKDMDYVSMIDMYLERIKRIKR